MMRCSSDVLKKTSPLNVFADVSEKVKHLTNDASNDVSPPALVPNSPLRSAAEILLKVHLTVVMLLLGHFNFVFLPHSCQYDPGKAATK